MPEKQLYVVRSAAGEYWRGHNLWDVQLRKAQIFTSLRYAQDALVPSPVVLRPYRTFIEVEQPRSSFIFRMKQGGHDEVSCALFEADGGAWTIEAMHNVAEYLRVHLDSEEGITVIS